MNNEIFLKLNHAVEEFDTPSAEQIIKQSLDDNIDPLDTLDILTKILREIGDKFESGEIYLPELIASGEVVSQVVKPLEEIIQEQGRKKESLGTVVVGTVFGDIHDIGKNMVATLFKAGGFNVIDCGSNVPAETFINSVIDNNADILALSTLLTTTAKEQKKIIGELENRGIRDKIKIMVGGGGITKLFADEIGADGFDATAPGAVTLGKKILGINEDAQNGKKRNQIGY